MLVATVVFTDLDGAEWTLTDYLTDTDKGGLKFRDACAARGVLDKFEAGYVEASDLPGPVRIKVGVEKRRGCAQILPVEVEQIEEIEGERGRISGIRGGLQDAEMRDAVGADAAQLAVEIGLLRTERRDRRAIAGYLCVQSRPVRVSNRTSP